MRTMRMRIGLSGPSTLETLRALRDTQFFGRGMPTRVLVDDREKKPSANWIEQWAASCRRSTDGVWGDHESSLTLDRDTIVKATLRGATVDASTLLAMLSSLPFELGSFDSVFEEWYPTGAAYRAPGFSNMHWPHGWACVFKGAGHDRLVSRRWLDYGPWLVRRGPHDTTLIQFHDLDADAATAFEQAKPGHDRMGISENGGFLQKNYVFASEVKGLYLAEQRQLVMVVHGRDVSAREMRDVCAVRKFQAMGESKPIDSVAYVFMEESEARAHLHELWLREIEVRTYIGGVETRIDADYRPVTKKPEWVKRLEATAG